MKNSFLDKFKIALSSIVFLCLVLIACNKIQENNTYVEPDYQAYKAQLKESLKPLSEGISQATKINLSKKHRDFDAQKFSSDLISYVKANSMSPAKYFSVWSRRSLRPYYSAHWS